ncbi:tryptophan synthase beta subunit-like PLP-dependent enzyme [Aspergillus minisclerotigenes]|uniref:Tryptophan synthase beta subunit-like PLP-dependent enzyme n=1 Tax=Aspergillus minisclerotigenes TaxID=656917 RepID=A0A5N6JC37_9EURO|nr:tryptophan synthase beta subunit-like PLP-dependent enzyme [Aspergillus minisclerotigenes]
MTSTAPTESQKFLSTRGGDYGLSFETVVLKGLAADGGLFLPHEVPTANDWQSWKDLSYAELAFKIVSLYISPSEIPPEDLKGIIERSYSTFRAEDVVPLTHLQDDNLYLLELFHGPSYSFKDCALQFLGNLFEYLLVRKNQGKVGKGALFEASGVWRSSRTDQLADRHHLTVVGATSGDTGSAAIYGLRGKKDVSVVILHPKGRVSPIQEAQMTTCTDRNVHNLAVTGTFDDCQDIVKAMFNDPNSNQALKLGAVNSINFSRILAQIVFYFYAYFQLARKSPTFKVGDKVRFVTPTGNFGNILAGYFATKMGLPADKLVVATNENDILHRFWTTGRYEKNPVQEQQADGTVKAEACKETPSPAMDILVSSNFERLMWFLAKEQAAAAGLDDASSKKRAGEEVLAWYQSLKATGGFGPVDKDLLENGRSTFDSDRVSNSETVETIKSCYQETKYVLDPHSAVAVTVAKRSLAKTGSNVHHISLSTAHPAKFSEVVESALKGEAGFNFDEQVLPDEFKAFAQKETRVTTVENSWEKVREIVKRQAEEDIKAESSA